MMAKTKPLSEFRPEKQRQILDMIAYFNKIMAEKTPKGNAVHGVEYALEKCGEKFYWSEATCKDYIARYS